MNLTSTWHNCSVPPGENTVTLKTNFLDLDKALAALLAAYSAS